MEKEKSRGEEGKSRKRGQRRGTPASGHPCSSHVTRKPGDWSSMLIFPRHPASHSSLLTQISSYLSVTRKVALCIPCRLLPEDVINLSNQTMSAQVMNSFKCAHSNQKTGAHEEKNVNNQINT